MTLELKGVARSVAGQVHVQPTDLMLEHGSMNVLLGPTLAGKTSLMRLMAGLDQPDSGRIFWDGRDVTGVRVQDRRVAMVYQQFINYPTMSVFDNIASPLRLMRRDRAQIAARVAEVAELLKLTPYLGRRPLELSGGQQQRCALARALVKDAGLVLLDEPLANLDYKLREELRAEIPRIFAASGAIFVYATTEPEEALLLGGRTATLWQGRIAQFGPTAQVYRHPRDTISARVFSDPPMNFLGLTKSGPRVSFAAGPAVEATAALSVLPDGSYSAGFRANHLQLGVGRPGTLGFSATVAETEITGSETFVHLDHGPDRWIALAPGALRLVPGQAQPVWLDPADVYVFDAGGAFVAQAARRAA